MIDLRLFESRVIVAQRAGDERRLAAVERDYRAAVERERVKLARLAFTADLASRGPHLAVAVEEVERDAAAWVKSRARNAGDAADLLRRSSHLDPVKLRALLTLCWESRWLDVLEVYRASTEDPRRPSALGALLRFEQTIRRVGLRDEAFKMPTIRGAA